METDIMLGELIPVGGGDPIPLFKKELLVGRRENVDIVLRFSNVSSHHCQLECHDGYWYVRDLGSKNGVRVNNTKVQEHLLKPGDELRIAKHKFRVEYSPADNGAMGPPPNDSMPREVMKQSLLERAGLAKKEIKDDKRSEPVTRNKFDLLNDQISEMSD